MNAARVKAVARRTARALVAAVSSTEAVKAEKNLAVLVISRTLLSVGASASLVVLVEKIVQSL
jgi:hypothetical protein